MPTITDCMESSYNLSQKRTQSPLTTKKPTISTTKPRSLITVPPSGRAMGSIAVVAQPPVNPSRHRALEPPSPAANGPATVSHSACYDVTALPPCASEAVKAWCSTVLGTVPHNELLGNSGAHRARLHPESIISQFLTGCPADGQTFHFQGQGNLFGQGFQ